jgi:error-prone DNA polymerase
MQLFTPAYAELHCLSNFSFLRGASQPRELVWRAHQQGYCGLAITDECSVAGVVRAYEAFKKLPKETPLRKLIIGTEITFDDGMKLVLLAADRTGYGHLCALITRGRMRAKKGSYRLTRADLGEGLPGCLALWVPADIPDIRQARFVAERFAGRAWLAAELFNGPNDRIHLARLREIGKASGLPLVAAGDVHMDIRSRRPLQDILTAIRLGIPVHQAGHALYPNAERHLRHRLRLELLYPRELLARSVEIAERCDFSLDSLRYEYPDEIVPPGHTPATYLRELTEEGLRWRFPEGVPQKVRSQIENELVLIAEKNYETYFLTVHDLVRFARSQEILCQGRGSAANSAVCYALGITEVDPARQNLLFERFLSRERNEPPDIDVDFEHQRREQVIQYIYQKYGRERAAIAATVITYQPRSAVRDIGKALGMEPGQVDRLAKSLSWWDRPDAMRQRLREAGFDPDNRVIRLLLDLLETLVGFPRHLSQHVGGFVISRGPLSHLVPIENAAMPERSVIQWDKDDLDTVGLLKVDVLALGMLSVIRRTLAFVNGYRLSSLTPQEILLERKDDEAVFEMIRRADTIGVFQIESRAQMTMLPRLKPQNFYDLVVEIAIVRPGPLQGGMVHPYLKRRQGLEPISYPSCAIREVLHRTLGVPIFQEQVMQLAMVAAGFTADEADQLRRSMASWQRKGSLEKFEAKLKRGILDKGYSTEFSNALWEQIKGFGEYGFPESHSASFALLAYVSAWLKYYEPASFLAGTLNSQPMGFYSPSALVQDARRHGVEVRPVDVTSSDWKCSLESRIASDESRPLQPAVRLGLLMVKGLSKAAGEGIVSARTQRPFVDIADLARRGQLNRSDLSTLASAGALASLSTHRREAHWLNAGLERQSALLEDANPRERPPLLQTPTEGEEIVADYESTGLTLGRHPLALLRRRLRRMRLSTATELQALPNGAPARGAGIVTCRQRPGTSRGVVFVTLEDETGYLNVVVWASLVERQRRELLNSRLLGVEGVMQKEGDVVHLVARRLTDHTVLLGRLGTPSRDFH